MFTIREIVSFYAIIVTIMKNNNIFEDKISWYDINEKGQIKDFLNFEPAVYVYIREWMKINLVMLVQVLY
jgi:hypothetical protein